MRRTSALFTASAVGAGLMYWLDPEAGRRRRTRTSDRAGHYAKGAMTGLSAALRDLEHRFAGTLASTASRLRPDDAGDDVIAARVHSALGYVCSHPRAVHVKSEKGRITLNGNVLAREHGAVIRAAARARGVRAIRDELLVREGPEAIPDLQGGIARRGRRFELFQTHWSPGARLLVGGVGAVAALRGLARPSPLPLALALAGAVLLARALVNTELGEVVSRAAAPPARRVAKPKTAGEAAPEPPQVPSLGL